MFSFLFSLFSLLSYPFQASILSLASLSFRHLPSLVVVVVFFGGGGVEIGCCLWVEIGGGGVEIDNYWWWSLLLQLRLVMGWSTLLKLLLEVVGLSLLTMLGGVFLIGSVIGFGGLRNEIFALGWMWVFVFWFYDEFRGGFGIFGGGFRWRWTMVVGCVVWWPVICGLGFVFVNFLIQLSVFRLFYCSVMLK